MSTITHVGRWLLWLMALILLSGLLLLAPANAQHQHGAQGQGMKGQQAMQGQHAMKGKQGHMDHRFDPATVATLSGVIARIDSIAMGDHAGIHLALAGDTTVVHLGPDWFLSRQQPVLQVGDTISATGSRVTAMGQPALIAAEVVRGDETLVLRDATGRPVWRGWRKHQLP